MSKNKNTKAFFLLLMILGLAGCQTLGGISTSHLKNISSVGIYSDLGKTLTYNDISLFSGAQKTNNVKQWNIDAFTEQSTLRAIKNTSRSAGIIKKTPKTRPFITHASVMEVSLLESFDKALSPLHHILDLAKSQGHDTAIILQPINRGPDSIIQGPYGYTREQLPLQGKDYCLYASFSMHVYNTKTKKRIAWERGFERDRYCADMPVEWKGDFDHYSSEEKNLIEKTIKKQITTGIANVLHKAGFVVP